ncbi:MBT domain-containing 1-like isoform X1 [Paramuricea clavata]|uniref:MBT domain-containing 1-like isoform X1 n=1 Tax=Paramuricea clavata TaxID=317549 RepID=A0A6S7GCX8_PARCT|nr:MBT domain-containing 1-like isoform X1 [Paramuricea clavata]
MLLQKMQERLRRTKTLEETCLLDNTRRWARDKADLQIKLSETQISQQSGQWQYPNLSQEPLSLFDRYTFEVPGLDPGMKLEAIDKNNPQSFCVATVVEVKGHRVRIRYDGYGRDSSNDFWCNFQAEELYPIGWCAQNAFPLQPPTGPLLLMLKFCLYFLAKKLSSPKHLFPSKINFKASDEHFQPKVHSFEIGMKLEVIHPTKPCMFCTILLVKRRAIKLKNYDYTHSIGISRYYESHRTVESHQKFNCKHAKLCRRGRRRLWEWSIYEFLMRFHSSKSKSHKFRAGHKLEAVDLEHPHVILVATITNVMGRVLQLFFDGQTRFQFVECDSPDIHGLAISRVDSRPKLERYLKRFCRRLVCCEYFLSLTSVAGPCPDDCKADHNPSRTNMMNKMFSVVRGSENGISTTVVANGSRTQTPQVAHVHPSVQNERSRQNTNNSHQNTNNSHQNTNNSHQNTNNSHQNTNNSHQNTNNSHQNTNNSHQNTNNSHQNTNITNQNTRRPNQNTSSSYQNTNVPSQNTNVPSQNTNVPSQNTHTYQSANRINSSTVKYDKNANIGSQSTVQKFSLNVGREDRQNLILVSSEFALDEAGDIRWKLHQTPSDYLPFLTCDSYELANCPDCKYKDCDQDSLALKLNLLGSETGELVPFLLTLSRDKTTMTIRYQYSPMLILKCKKCAVPADAVEVTLHYFYAGCLPSDVQEETVERICTLLKNNKKMKKLHEICAQYLESTALKRKINNLLNCIYGVIDEAYDVLNDMKNKDTFKSPHGNGLCDARNILEAFKQIAR